MNLLIWSLLGCGADPSNGAPDAEGADSADSADAGEGAEAGVFTLALEAGSDDATWHPDGFLLVSDLLGAGSWPRHPAGEQILAVDPDSGAVSVYASGVPLPLGSSLAPDGTLYVASYGESAGVWAVPPGGGEGVEIAGGLRYPTSLVVADDGALWVAEWGADRIVRLADGEASTLVAMPAPVGMDRRPDGAVIAGGGDGWIYVIDPEGVATPWVEAPGTDFAVVGQDTYASALNGHEVVRIGPDGEVSRFVGTGAAGDEDGPLGEATLNHPNGVAASPDGARLYVQQLDRRLRVVVLGDVES